VPVGPPSIFRVEQPGITGVGGEQCQGPNRHKATVVFGGTTLDVTDLLGELKVLAVNVPLARPALDASPAHPFAPLRVMQRSNGRTAHPVLGDLLIFCIPLFSTASSGCLCALAAWRETF